MKRAIAGLLILLFLTGSWSLVFKIQPVKARTITVPDDYPTIQDGINAADPGDTIFVRTGVYYEWIYVNKPNLTIVGENNIQTVIASYLNDFGESILIVADNVTLTGFRITGGAGAYSGIALQSGTILPLNSININNNYVDFFEQYGISAWGGACTHSIFYNNTVGACGGAGIGMEDCYNNTIIGNIAENDKGYGGIFIGGGGSNTIIGNNLVDSRLDLVYSVDNNLSRNNVTRECIILAGCNKTTVERNQMIDGNGLQLQNWVHGSSENVFIENIIRNNSCGISITDGNDNSFVHNSFIDNVKQADVRNFSNIWDDGYPSGGNYWSDYNGTDAHSGLYQNEAGSDGIGDLPYIIDSFNRDNYPLMKPYFGPHDVGMISLNLSKTVVGKGYCLNSSSTTINYGEVTESVNATLSANETEAQTDNVLLPSRNSTTIPFVWNTSSFGYGNYTLKACIPPVANESDILDNNCTCGFPVHVGVPGDVSSSTQGVYDMKCDMKDIAYLVILFNTKPTSPNWNPNADVDNNGVVSMKDIAIAILNFNKHE